MCGVYQLATGHSGLESEESKHRNTETNCGHTTLHIARTLLFQDRKEANAQQLLDERANFLLFFAVFVCRNSGHYTGSGFVHDFLLHEIQAVFGEIGTITATTCEEGTSVLTEKSPVTHTGAHRGWLRSDARRLKLYTT